MKKLLMAFAGLTALSAGWAWSCGADCACQTKFHPAFESTSSTASASTSPDQGVTGNGGNFGKGKAKAA